MHQPRNVCAVSLLCGGILICLTACAVPKQQVTLIPHEPDRGPRSSAGDPPIESVTDDGELLSTVDDLVAEIGAETDEFAQGVGDSDADGTESPLDTLAEVEADELAGPLEDERRLAGSMAPEFDIPIEVNDRVLAWVDLYTGRFRSAFSGGLARSGRYLEMFREIFAEAGIPEDLVYMAAVESGYKTTAFSRARAKGIFQFMVGTARLYGLRVDSWVDERADPEKSARAAAAYMKRLYAEFGDWNLALAAYNAGEGKVRRAIASTGQTDFWELAKTRHLHTETKNHVPAVLAATLISKQPEKYGLSFVPEPALTYETIPIAGAVDLVVLAECAGTDTETLAMLNPALRRAQTPPSAVTDLRVPSGVGEVALAALAAIPESQRVRWIRHVVARGDSLSRMGKRYGVSVSEIQAANSMGRSTLIHSGQALRIPSASSRTWIARDAEATPRQAPRGKALTYRVRPGDTLYALARRYDTTPQSIASASGIRPDRGLRIGERLRVVPGSRAESAGAESSSVGSAGQAVTHRVRQGDTLWSLAHRYGTSVAALCSWNSIAPAAILRPGLRLTVGFK